MLWACEVIYFRAIYCAVYQVFEMGFQINVLSYKAQSVVCVFKRKWQIKLTIFFFTLIHKEQRLFQLQTAARRFGMKHSPITNGCNDHVFMKLLPEQNCIYVFMFRLFFFVSQSTKSIVASLHLDSLSCRKQFKWQKFNRSSK